MLNIIASDFFRIRKGKTLFGIGIGMVILIAIVALTLGIVTSPAVYSRLTEAGDYLSAEDQLQLEAMGEELPQNGGEFLGLMFTEGGSAFALFLLPFIISVFGADYSSGAYRNLLTYHSNRSGIYLAKIITNFILTLLMVVGFCVVSMIFGSVVFGFGGFSLTVFAEVIKGILLTTPMLLALICTGHCILAFMKKTSYTISIYIVGLIVWSMILQMAGMLFSKLGWLMELDLMNALQTVLKTGPTVITMVFSVIVIAVTTVLGISRYNTTDFDFS